jgi:hypothetical protein
LSNVELNYHERIRYNSIKGNHLTMNIAILGTGNVGAALGKRWAGLGHNELRIDAAGKTTVKRTEASAAASVQLN